MLMPKGKKARHVMKVVLSTLLYLCFQVLYPVLRHMTLSACPCHRPLWSGGNVFSNGLPSSGHTDDHSGMSQLFNMISDEWLCCIILCIRHLRDASILRKRCIKSCQFL
ncbi:hypothetical protein GE09DRAFT_334392 [Coniochaeta sp. 2T2.1]|nr:hypothetical protein GE09DRAFT_334392 [Coniochaeta sp. 2T2.1]